MLDNMATIWSVMQDVESVGFLQLEKLALKALIKPRAHTQSEYCREA